MSADDEMPTFDPTQLTVLRYAVKVAECDCCTDRTVHLAVMAEVNHGQIGLLDVQFDVDDLDDLYLRIEAERSKEAIDYVIPPANGQSMVEVTWHLTKEGDRRVNADD